MSIRYGLSSQDSSAAASAFRDRLKELQREEYVEERHQRLISSALDEHSGTMAFAELRQATGLDLRDLIEVLHEMVEKGLLDFNGDHVVKNDPMLSA